MCEHRLASSQTRVTETLAEGLPAAVLDSDTDAELLKLSRLFQIKEQDGKGAIILLVSSSRNSPVPVRLCFGWKFVYWVRKIAPDLRFRTVSVHQGLGKMQRAHIQM